MIPKITGINLLKAIRAQADYQNVPVVVYTNAFYPKVVQAAVEAGALKVFDKSQLTPSMLTREFEQALKKGN